MVLNTLLVHEIHVLVSLCSSRHRTTAFEFSRVRLVPKVSIREHVPGKHAIVCVARSIYLQCTTVTSAETTCTELSGERHAFFYLQEGMYCFFILIY